MEVVGGALGRDGDRRPCSYSDHAGAEDGDGDELFVWSAGKAERPHWEFPPAGTEQYSNVSGRWNLAFRPHDGPGVLPASTHTLELAAVVICWPTGRRGSRFRER